MRLAAARALIDTDKDAETIVRRALDIAADICVYTNRNVTIETLQAGIEAMLPAYAFRPMSAERPSDHQALAGNAPRQRMVA